MKLDLSKIDNRRCFLEYFDKKYLFFTKIIRNIVLWFRHSL